MRKGSNKSMMINAEVQKEISNIIHNELKDPRVHPMTSVISCDVTVDLKYCKVYVSVLADDESKKETMEGLKKAAPFVRRQLAATVNLRNTPEIKFILDESIENGIYMSRLISDVVAHDDAVIAARGDQETEETDPEEFEEEEEEEEE